MNFLTTLPSSEQEYRQLFTPLKINAICEDQINIEKDLLILLNKLFLGTTKLSIALLSKQTVFLPYLSLVDNLFIASRIKSKYKKETLNELFSLFQLDQAILFKSFDQLNRYEQIQLQLMQILLSDKENIIIEDIFSEITIYQRQQFLPLLKKIVKLKNKSILLFTSDNQIVESSYIDKVLQL